MQGSWFDVLGVRDILQSLSEGNCNEDECASNIEVQDGPTQPTPAEV